MRRYLFIFFLLITLLSCNDEVKKPENLIPREEMKAVLKDFYIYKQIKTYKVDTDLPEISEINLAILKSHGVSLDQFKTSYDYYVIHDASYDEILNEIRSDLEAQLPADRELPKPE